jgi:hypothetical protein
MLPAVFLFVGFLFWKSPWRLKTIEERIPEHRAALGGLITAMLLGFALNDSGIAVPGMMLGVVSASVVFLMLRIDRIVESAGGSEGAGKTEEADGEASTATDRSLDEATTIRERQPEGEQSVRT